jgi:hypothetical protein
VLDHGVPLVLSIFVIGQGKGAWKEKVTIAADFRQVSGLKKGSPVQLEGIEIGVVQDREFVEIEYACSPLTEDRGRFGQGRTDDCDRTMFCAPEGKCAELEPYSFNKDLHPPCEEDAQCREDEVCVTSEFRRRYRRVSWTGNTGVCDGYTTNHKRIRVTLSGLQGQPGPRPRRQPRVGLAERPARRPAGPDLGRARPADPARRAHPDHAVVHRGARQRQGAPRRRVRQGRGDDRRHRRAGLGDGRREDRAQRSRACSPTSTRSRARSPRARAWSARCSTTRAT